MKKDKMRSFGSGAIRDKDENKLQFSRCLSPIVLIRFVEFLRGHNKIAGGKRREDNWKKGFTRESYIESKFRHFVETWLIQDGLKEFTDVELLDGKDLEELIVSLCAELFNTQGFLHMLLLEQRKRKGQKATKKILKDGLDGKFNFPKVDLDECLMAMQRQKGRNAAKKRSIKATRKPKPKPKVSPIHFYPVIRHRNYGSAICGLPIPNGFSKKRLTKLKSIVTCETCKKILNNY